MAEQSAVAETVSKADLYALREFLVRHYAATNKKFSLPTEIRTREMLGGDHYLFTHVNEEEGTLGFQLRRARGPFRFYDLVDFSYSDRRIQVQKKEVKDESDAEKVSGLVELLEKKCYGGVIFNLDQLSE